MATFDQAKVIAATTVFTCDPSPRTFNKL